MIKIFIGFWVLIFEAETKLFNNNYDCAIYCKNVRYNTNILFLFHFLFYLEHQAEIIVYMRREVSFIKSEVTLL